ncbi:MAG: PTS fructose transporter subunit IIA [Chromatiaceae bacterium]
MSVGLLLITHNGIGSALLETATTMLGRCPLRVETLAVSADAERDILEVRAGALADRLDEGDGVLVLTDLFGSTPANVANMLKQREGCFVLTGVNLPMLVRVLNYPSLAVDDMAAKALSGGKDGVVLCNQRDARTG